MTERPILFSGAMVRALLAGRKTQTRRLVNARDAGAISEAFFYADRETFAQLNGDPSRFLGIRCPYGAPGDRLWVRETWAPAPPIAPLLRHVGASLVPERKALYRANPEQANLGVTWRPSIHMPRWASRLTLEVTGVRVERLQEITPTDAIAEGIERGPEPHPSSAISAGWRDYLTGKGTSGPVSSFGSLWESINGADSWAENPWVWCVSFKRVTP